MILQKAFRILLLHIKKNIFLWASTTVIGFFASLITIYQYFIEDEISTICRVRLETQKLNYAFSNIKKNFIRAEASYDEFDNVFRANIEFNENITFGKGGQIFRDTQRKFAVQNAARKLINTLTALQKEGSSYIASVNFMGGADGTGGNEDFSRKLDIGDLIIAARTPTINGNPTEETLTFQSGQSINNIKLALVRAAFVSDIFLKEVNDIGQHIVFSDLYTAKTYTLIGAKYRYGRIDMKINWEDKAKILPYLPISIETVCNITN
ncbi:hypothetical protein [Rhodobium gokarnense]|uniref:MacB-like periplasmic core domain-containing protein n=1 Tax=Rhodobium gokarnense TaxID=364296 RepID=A0ABT3HHZ2_9HYPH|nr:hypothetical protein [Rhodobium gokarnense]MCW2310031.1 hypothetical protein [Rhodobium gokarnense]